MPTITPDFSQVPDGKRHFAEFLPAYLEYQHDQEGSAFLHKWVAISIVAAALERRVWLDRGTYTLFPNLYVFVVGDSGIVKKSTTCGSGVEILMKAHSHKRDRKIFRMSDRMTSGSIVTQFERAGHEFEYVNENRAVVKVAQSPCFLYASELKQTLTEVHGSMVELLTDLYDCKPNDPTVPWSYENKMEGRTDIFGPCINFLAASTQRWLSEVIPAGAREGGFASRILFACEHEPPLKWVAWPHMTPERRALREKLIDDMSCIFEITGPFRVTPEARVYGEVWYKTHSEKWASNRDKRLSGYAGRKMDHALKLAMVISAMHGDARTIGVSEFEGALELLEELEPRMLRAFDTGGANFLADATDRVFEEIRIRGEAGLYMSQATSVFRRDLSQRDFLQVCDHLRAMGAIRVLKNGAETRMVAARPSLDSE